MSGQINYYDPGDVPKKISRNFPLFGVNAEYTLSGGNNFYGGWSQAYRPVIFQDIIPATPFEASDDNLKDAAGYNLEAGYRGALKGLRWDVSAFALRYNNRTGVIAGDASGGGIFSALRTNIGDSHTEGIEFFMEYPFLQTRYCAVTAFTSTSLFRSEYINASVRSGAENVDISGNDIESVPDIISRNGLTIQYRDLSVSLLYSYTGESFADPLNTIDPSPSGSVGIVPAYGLLDINTSVKVFSTLVLRINISNVTDKQYFTKRPEFYPGPGIWPSDGRSINCSLAFKIPFIPGIKISAH
jgi:Fe(3+) dicitrate transport protein